MNYRVLALNLLAALAYSGGAVFMKRSSGLTIALPAALLYLLFGVGATLQAIALKNGELGSAVVAVLGAEAIAAFTLGAVLFHEPVTLTKLAAVALVAGGVYLLSL